MAHKTREAVPTDLFRLIASRRRQRVLRLNPPYSLIQPDALLHDLWKSQAPRHSRTSFVYVYIERDSLLGYVQARSRGPRRDEWAITALAANDRAPDRIWEALLEELVGAAGEHEALRVSVKVPRDEPRMEAFKRLGFTHYTDERIWGRLYFSSSSAPGDEPQHGTLRRQTNGDAWDLMRLYSAVTPPAVQRAEDISSMHWQRSRMPKPLFLSHGLLEKSYVWPDASSDGEGLGGNIRLLTGESGHWISMMCKPDHDNRSVCPVALDYMLWKAMRSGNKPVYCGVREYQVEIEHLLEERGFHPLSEQELLVKYLAEPIKTRQHSLVPFLVPKQREVITSKFALE
ncbi:MAG TPA: hypothetical protein VGE45_07915 [Chloroflexia bacterium]